KADLKVEMAKIFQEKEISNLTITVCSFGFKYGTLTDADLIFDVRFIPNPYYIPELKEYTGEDEAVKAFVLKNAITEKFIEKISDLLTFLIPHYTEEGKSGLIIGIGCTGGRHRSVAIAEELKNILEEGGERVVLTHRDIKR
ncbi:MAG: RNase adapter RapZ, partial [Peptoniphilus sp.]|nr:RNase adapter RapZ [Peptoniphilus sp.]